MREPIFAFDAIQFLNDPLPTRTDRDDSRLWVVGMDVTTIPLTFNLASNLYHPIKSVKTHMDWFVQEGLIHRVSTADTSWYDVDKESPLYVEFTPAERIRIGNNIAGFLCSSLDAVFIGTNASDPFSAIPPIIRDLKFKANTLLALMKEDPTKDYSFSLRKASDGKATHIRPELFNTTINHAAAILGGYDKLLTTNAEGIVDVDWKTVVDTTGLKLES